MSSDRTWIVALVIVLAILCIRVGAMDGRLEALQKRVEQLEKAKP